MICVLKMMKICQVKNLCLCTKEVHLTHIQLCFPVYIKFQDVLQEDKIAYIIEQTNIVIQGY
jgi:hypothetical protein